MERHIEDLRRLKDALAVSYLFELVDEHLTRAMGVAATMNEGDLFDELRGWREKAQETRALIEQRRAGVERSLEREAAA